MNKYLSVLMGPTFIAAMILTGCSGEGTDNAQLEADLSPVIPKVNSTVIKINVKDNQKVKKGDTLVLLDTATYSIAVRQAEIALLQARRNVKVAANGRTNANVKVSNVTASSDAVSANLSAADAKISSERAKLAVAQKNYERYGELLAQKSATQQQFDQIKADQADAQAQLQNAISQRDVLLKQIQASRFQIASTRTEVSNNNENISLAELAVEQAKTSLDAARLQLSYCKIIAPSDGIVSKKNIQLGQVVSIGQPLMAIANDEQVWVVANFKETQLEKMRTGQDVDIEVDAYGDTTFKGRVESFSQATGAKFSFIPADNATGNFVKVTQRVPVKIMIENGGNSRYPLRAGMSVYVKVKTK